jgi:adenylate cyclase
MSIRLVDLSACFEGAIPSVIATAAADGTPNVSYLSHVVRVDEDHVALSNQFFAKTAANIRANPFVTMILVDCFTGEQYMLDVRFVRSLDAGPLFDDIARHLAASSAQIGMADVMRLKSADVFRVESITALPSPLAVERTSIATFDVRLPALAAALRELDDEEDLDGIVETLLRSACALLGCRHAQILVPEREGDCFVTIGSTGYEPSGIGSEVSSNDGLIGMAAATGKVAKIADTSRYRRFGEAIVAADGSEEETRRHINRPSFGHARSQVAVPLRNEGKTVGVLFLESERVAAFTVDGEAALDMLALASARSMRSAEGLARSPKVGAVSTETVVPPRSDGGDSIQVVHHRFDDSIFIDGFYVVKGIAGAILQQMLEWHRDHGRIDFTNRELRLALAARMPDFKDNLETRLLLLRRRLEEKRSKLRLVRTGRGRLRLVVAGDALINVDQR